MMTIPSDPSLPILYSLDQSATPITEILLLATVLLLEQINLQSPSLACTKIRNWSNNNRLCECTPKTLVLPYAMTEMPILVS